MQKFKIQNPKLNKFKLKNKCESSKIQRLKDSKIERFKD